jgi:DNA invertase Pin-like site-specific DNA recombinase
MSKNFGNYTSAQSSAVYLRLPRFGAEGTYQRQIASIRLAAEKYGCIITETYRDWIEDDDANLEALDRLKADIVAGKVHCVFCRNLSALGSDLAKTKQLINRYFLKRGVRLDTPVERLVGLNLR